MTTYYKEDDLPKFGELAEGNPDLYQRFRAWFDAAVAGPGALTLREKALIGLAVSHALQCPYCIDSFTTKSLEAGADLSQMTEAVHIASAMRGGSTLIHGVQMLNRHESISM